MATEAAEDATRGVRIRHPNATMDQSQVRYERNLRLKASRSAAKGIITRRRNEAREMMSDFGNPYDIEQKLVELDEAITGFEAAHQAYHNQLDDPNEIEDSLEYYEVTMLLASDSKRIIEDWIQKFKQPSRAANLKTLDPEDSISNVGSRATSRVSQRSKASSRANSKSSRRSSVSSARIAAAAKRASLTAEASMLREQQALQQEELRLQQRKQELALETEIAKAEAEERALAEAEVGISVRGAEKSSRNLAPAVKVESYLTKEPRENQQPPIRIMQHPVAEVNGKESRRRTFEDRESQYSTSSEEGLRLLLDLQRQQQEQNRNMLNIQQQQNQQVQQLLKQQQLHTLALTLPQLEVPTFAGDPIEYCRFIRAFESMIVAKTTSYSARMYYLVQYTAGDVQELMRSCLAMDSEEGYREARKLLAKRYGQPYKIASAYVERVTNGPAIKEEDGAALQSFSALLTTCKNTLNEIGYLSKIENPDSLKKVVARLPFSLRQKWREVADEITEAKAREVTIADIADFVEKKARILTHPIFGDIISEPKSKSVLDGKRLSCRRLSSFAADAYNPSSSTDDDVSDDTLVLGPRRPTLSCPLCKATHWLSQCKDFRRRNVSERYQIAREKELCYNCLIPGHYAAVCPKTSFCKVDGCDDKHSTFLHPPAVPAPNGTQSDIGTQSAYVNVDKLQCAFSGVGGSVTGLPVVPVKVRAKGSDTTVHTYAFLDGGSNTSFCSEQLMKRLGVKGVNTTISLTTMERESSTRKCELVQLEVFDLEEENFIELPLVFSTPKLPVASESVPRQEDVDRWPHLKGVTVAEINADVGLLIGHDVPKALEPKEVRESQNGGPYAAKTLLGWAINGPLGRNGNAKRTSNFIRADTALDQQFQRFCNMEFNDSLLDNERAMSLEDKRALNIMESTAVLKEGHYEIAMPWRYSPLCLPNNRILAVHRLELLRRRLVKDPVLFQKYSAFVDNLLDKAYARKVPDNRLARSGEATWFLPHHPVFHPKKPGKVRVVFDCAAKYKGVSLNDVLLQGPDMTNTLVGVLTRFRQERTAIIADIESMFYQALVRPDDSDVHVLRFLWWPGNDLQRRPEEYQMTVHLFGAVSSFKDLHDGQMPVERALGVRWDVEGDIFCFKIEVNDKPLTRRGLLSVVSSVYDPLGFAAPVILPARAILQDLCRKRLEWDDPIPTEEKERWLKWLKDLPKLERFSVDRCFKPQNFGRTVSLQLHHFSDASQQGYGAVSYLRSKDDKGTIHCSFVMGKARTAPLKSITIPRLELSAAVLASRLDKIIRREIDLPVHESVFWTDSTCVMNYIRSNDKRFHTFVANRVAIIHDGSTPSQWRYVNTEANPADDASRGLAVDSLIKKNRWIRGPDFLWEQESRWPAQPTTVREIPDDDPEIKKETRTFSAVSDAGANSMNKLLEKFSSWSRLKKIVAWILRIRDRLRASCERCKRGSSLALKSTVGRESESINVDEIDRAEKEVLKFVQRQSFEEEMSRLEQKGGGSGDNSSKRSKEKELVVKKTSAIYKLAPMKIDGLLYVGGRLTQASIPNAAKHQLILPKKHHVVDLIVRHYHLKSGHSGLEHVLSLIRERFWILKARTAVKSVLRGCFDCKRRQAPLGEQQMADLPTDRVTPEKPPFTFVGVDCFGPFVVRRGRSLVKRYGVLFTCLSIRAIHLEVAHSLDTDSFINAMRRFIARRGQPEEVRSDNGGNFVRGERELREAIEGWNQNKIGEFMLQRNVRWTFNPPGGSHHGGVWERCIRTVRKVMGALTKEQILDDEGLATLLCEVESIVNGRPVTKVSDDPRDMEALTPNHLLLLRSGPSAPPGLFFKDEIYSRRRWRQVQYLADIFWRRWIKEYLPSLQERQKWNRPRRNFAVDDIVLVADLSCPRSCWPIGRILDVHRNTQDGYVRRVTVQTKGSILQRPIDKIVFLESAN